MRKGLFVWSALMFTIIMGGCNSNLSTEETPVQDNQIVDNNFMETEENFNNDNTYENNSKTGFELKLLDEFNGSEVKVLSDNRLFVEINGDLAIYNENLELVKNLEKGSKVTVLSDNRFFVDNDANSIIYDESFKIVKELGDVRLSEDDELGQRIFNGIFVYEEPYYHDSKMDYKIGLMDFDGNILYDAIFINPDDDFKDCSEDDGLCMNERKIAEIYDVLYSFEADDRYTYSNGEKLAYIRHTNTDERQYGLALVKTYPHNYEVIKELGRYDEIEITSGSCLTSDCNEYIEVDDYFIEDRISIGFKNNGKWGIVDFDGNHILEAQYEELDYMGHDKNQNVDYYRVINDTGRVGVFSTENGLIIEPTFNLKDNIKLLNSNIVVQPSNVELTKIYNSNGDMVKEFEFYAEISYIDDLLEKGNYSKEFYNIKRKGSYEVDLGLLDSNFEYSPLLYETDGYGYYTSYATISDEVIIGYEDLFKSGKTTCALLTLDGILIENLSCNYISSITVFNGKYLCLDKKIYELVGLY